MTTVFFRLILAPIPHLIVVALWGFAAALVSIILWIALVFEQRGRPPRCSASSLTYVRYFVQVSGYIHIVASPWPRFGGSDGYPIDVELDVARRQSRYEPSLPRLFLALPPLLLAAAIGGGAWFGDAADGRAPTHLRSRLVGRSPSAGGLAATAAFLAWFASVAQGTHAPRPPRPGRVRDRVHGPGELVYLFLVTYVYPTTDPNRRPPHGVAAAPAGAAPAHRPTSSGRA